jgi:hypothetical protein
MITTIMVIECMITKIIDVMTMKADEAMTGEPIGIMMGNITSNGKGFSPLSFGSEVCILKNQKNFSANAL